MSDNKPNPRLEDLQPLYQAVAHGCEAEWQQEAFKKVFVARIQRGTESDGFYSTKKLGAFASDLGGVACFFEQPWSRVSPVLKDPDQAWMLNHAATCLRALGRLTEALDPMRGGLESYVTQKDWKGAGYLANNLSELELTLGEVVDAVDDAERSVTYAERSGDAFLQMAVRTTHADALYQVGHRALAEARFRDAEQLQSKIQPNYPKLVGIAGFRYCDLLLGTPERAAWREILRSETGIENTLQIQSCRAVYQRAAETINWLTNSFTNASSFDIALDHLALGRAALNEAVLSSDSASSFSIPASHLSKAVDGLRRSGQKNMLPTGLLTRAWLRFLTGTRTGPESAQADLDEAWEIAERGPMRLFMADIQLHRARLFFREARYPWTSPRDDLAAARKLIEQCGYGRRQEELEDAEAAIAARPS